MSRFCILSQRTEQGPMTGLGRTVPAFRIGSVQRVIWSCMQPAYCRSDEHCAWNQSVCIRIVIAVLVQRSPCMLYTRSKHVGCHEQALPLETLDVAELRHSCFTLIDQQDKSTMSHEQTIEYGVPVVLSIGAEKQTTCPKRWFHAITYLGRLLL